MSHTDSFARARTFLSTDPDPETRAELTALLTRADAGDEKARLDVVDRFSGSLAFGTAGLRGRVEAGTARMNRAVVIQTTWGLGSYLLEQGHAFGLDAKASGVVIGFDGRLSSRQFAIDTAAVLTALGIPVHAFVDPVTTPLCAYAVGATGACAGVMITASHNPPYDNGYKAYWANAAQIIPPHDTGIAAAIARAPAANAIARMAPPDAAGAGLQRIITDDLERAYLEGVSSIAFHRERAPALRIVYTAMHGVGHRTTIRALARAGFHGIIDVPSQVDPDGTFRTVAFPNPEEKGALDRALAVALESKAQLILANDPDADRLAVGVSVDEGKTFRLLTGNETGVLLAADALEHMDTGGKKKLVITTIVSSTMLSRIAAGMDAAYEETLTGFKWIANKAMERERDGLAFVCGYEEALGYSVGPLVRDKDGVSAAVRFAEMARALAVQGKTVLDRLDELAVRFGLSVAHNWSITMPGASGLDRIRAAMAALRAKPPTELEGMKVSRVVDLAKDAMAADVVVLHTEDGARLTVRPSGTEPKIKMYLELVARIADVAALPDARSDLRAKGVAVERYVNALLGL